MAAAAASADMTSSGALAAPGRPDGALVAGMVDLGFWHELDGFFVRPALGGKEREAEDG